MFGHAGRAGVGHAQRAFEQFGGIQAHQRRGQQSEIRERRKTAADVRVVREHAAESALRGQALKRRSRIGDRDEIPARFNAFAFAELGVKIIAVGQWLGRRSGFAGDDEQGGFERVLALDAEDRGRVGAVEHRHRDSILSDRERPRQNDRRHAASPHSHVHRAAKARGLHFGDEPVKLVEVFRHFLGHVQPTERIADHLLPGGVLRPKRRILIPQPGAEALLLENFNATAHMGFVSIPFGRLAVHAFLQRGLARRADGLHQPVEGLVELFHSLVLQLLGNLLDVDPQLRQPLEDGLGFGQPFRQRRGRFAVIAVGADRFDRHSVDSLRPDQRLDVFHVAVARVLGAGAGPQQALGSRAPACQRLETRSNRTSHGKSNRRAWRWRWRSCPWTDAARLPRSPSAARIFSAAGPAERRSG